MGLPEKLTLLIFLEPPSVVFYTTEGGINSIEILYPITHKILFCVAK
jgi:hypothetical protein